MANPNPNTSGLVPLKKGYDPRRNLRGVPKETIAMRHHIRKIAAELLESDKGDMTRLDAMLRLLFTSRNPAHNRLALQTLDPQLLSENLVVEQRGTTKVIIEYVDSQDTTPPPAQGAAEDQE